MHSPTHNTTHSPMRCRRARRSARSRGAVIVLSLLGAFFVAAMIAYVFNTGRHAQLRQQTQSAADATAITGAGYIARSFNTVAMNNVEISRLIAVVQMLDAIPLSVEYTLLDVRATLTRTEQQLASGVGDPTGDRTLEEIRDDLREQERLLEEMDRFFNRGNYDVREMTFYDSEFGRGELWKAMESLDAISTATMEHIFQLTNDTGSHTGQINLPIKKNQTFAAIGLPIDGNILFWERYKFDDFRDPVTKGRLPEWADDEVTNRGPYDTIFGWRSAQRESIEIPNPDYGPNQNQNTQTKRASSRWSGGTGRGGRSPRTISIGSRLIGYTTYGTWQWLGDVLRARVDQQEVLYNSQFVTRVNRMGGNKLNYLWPGSAQQWVFLDPQWITSFEQAESIIAARTPRVAYTQFIRMDYQQRFINGQAVGPEVMTDWSILRPRGGYTSVPGARKTRNHVWEDDASVKWTTGSGIQVQTHEIRYRWIFVWAGINVGPEVEIRDPNNFASRDDLPAPIDFDYSNTERNFPAYDSTNDSTKPYSPFTYIAVAKQDNEAPLWPRLYNTSAFNGHVAVAQVSVFNNHSWDLWTQMWHAQLEPVQLYEERIDLMQSNQPEITEVLDYLQSLKPLSRVMLQH